MQRSIPIPEPVLVHLLSHASAAAYIVGHIDDRIVGIEPLSDHIDAMVHNLTELLGDPHTLATSDAVAPDDRVAQRGASMLASGAGGAP